MSDANCLLCQLEERQQMEDEYEFFKQLYDTFLECNYGNMKKIIKEQSASIKSYSKDPNIDSEQVDREMERLIEDIHEKDDFFHEQLDEHNEEDNPFCSDCENWAKYVAGRLIDEDWDEAREDDSSIIERLRERLREITGKGFPGEE